MLARTVRALTEYSDKLAIGLDKLENFGLIIVKREYFVMFYNAVCGCNCCCRTCFAIEIFKNF